MTRIERALLSVSDKRGLTGFARGLAERGVELLASGGTAEALRHGGMGVRGISDYTGSPELLGGRVKTLHPKIHAGILARRDDPRQSRELERHGIAPIDLVVVNLYPFETQVRRETPVEQAMEWVDIGGETLIRAAAKNFSSVGVIVDPDDYERVSGELDREGRLSAETRRYLAAKAFQHVTRYNALISRWLTSDEEVPGMLLLAEPCRLTLRYGENPHQQGGLYGPEGPNQLQGKPLSFVNVLDADAALKCAREFPRPTAAVIKHATPCGVASDGSLQEAFRRAYQADPKSAFGGIIGLNRALDAATAREIAERRFEVVVAPDYSEEALEALHERKNLRVLRAPASPFDRAWESRSTSFGLLAQTPSSDPERGEGDLALQPATSRRPTREHQRDLNFAWRVVKHAKSNAIVIAGDETTLGIGSGQVSRVDAVEIALKKTGSQTMGRVMASDAFFPFRDSVDLAGQAGIEAIIQPGGSVRDEEVIAAAEEHGIAMVFTEMREFKH